jgi:bacteriocin biosynthesis cyclodehydratase domain-containing protein
MRAQMVEHSSAIFCRAVAVIPTNSGVLIKRGATEILVGGDQASSIIKLIIREAQDGLTTQRIDDLFSQDERAQIWELINQLIKRDILYVNGVRARNGIDETPLDVFFWHFGTSASDVERTFRSKHFTVVGHNATSIELIQALLTCGAEQISFVDDPALRGELQPASRHPPSPSSFPHPELADKWRSRQAKNACDLLIAVCEFGVQELLRPWNELCVASKIPFVPVLIENAIAHLGPFVLAAEGPCLECLRIRQNSNARNPELMREIQTSFKPFAKLAGVHPLILATVANVAAFEITRFFSPIPRKKVGSVIEINLLDSSMTSRKVLKVPRCPVCSSSVNRPSTAAFENPLYLPPE